MHGNKGRTVAQCLKDRTDYAKNGEKTEQGEYISSYECDPQIVDQEFLAARAEYLKERRVPKGDIIAYQIRQSFQPGEVTPEEANRVGYETAMRFTKGKHAFIVATHVDRAHIHNHIIYNSTNLECNKKFRNFLFSGIALQKVSDLVCLEHGLSVIKKRNYSERAKRTEYPERKTIREEIRAAVDAALAKKPKDFEELLQLLSEAGYEIKSGKHVAVRGAGQKRYIRFRSLGEGYREDDIKKIIAGETTREDRGTSSAKSKRRDFDLLIDIQDKLAQGKGAGYERWAKVYNVKQVAKALLFLQENDIHDMETLAQKSEDATKKFNELSTTIKSAEKRMGEIAVLKTHIINYSKTRPVYMAYRKAGFTKEFFEKHREEITLHKAAKDAFDALPPEQKPNGKVPTVQVLSEEYARLLGEKKAAYSEYRQAKKDMQDYLIAKRDIEKILGADMEEVHQEEKKRKETTL
jgi:hypothetical protein